MTSNRMWSGGYAGEIDLPLNFSSQLLLSLVCLYGSVAALLILLPGAAAVLAAAALLALSLLGCARLPGLGWSPAVVVRATAHDDQSWTLQERGGASYEARLSAGLVFGTKLIFLSWDGQGGKRVQAVLFNDISDATALRRLRALLLRAAEASGDAGQGARTGTLQDDR